MTPPAVLVLRDGTVYRGTAFGRAGETSGEVCFNTGMTGYQEILTDPSYHGQIVTLTTAHVGNYGVNDDDAESARIQAAGLVVREGCALPSSHRAARSLPEWMDASGTVGIQDVDTRALTRHIRSEGAMNGVISSDGSRSIAELVEQARALPPMSGLDLTGAVTCAAPYAWPAGGEALHASDAPAGGEPCFRVAALDFGIKRNILRLLAAHGCAVTVYPAGTAAADILAARPDGVFLSNGPGDPEAVGYGIATVRALLGRVPLFGICLGHQLLALALGARTYKLPFGHRGCNHPVRNLATGAVEITSQNHGFAVDAATLPAAAAATHWNLNDQTLEGFRCADIPAFSVQYHPEAAPGPHDSRSLFRAFTDLMERHAAA